MEVLQELLKKALADTFALYLKAHNFHWNVEGVNFPQYHEFFGNLYEEVHGAIDKIAEEIRALDSYAPGSLKRFSELSTIMDETSVPSAVIMCQRLAKDNDSLLIDLELAYSEAERVKQLGLANFLQDRMDVHKKHGWMLRSIQKG